MSSQISKRCDANTIKGRKCRNYSIKGEKLCCIHKKQLSSKLIVHTAPVVKFQPIVFSQHIPSQHTCQFKNKFGEFVCNNETKDCKFCDEHNEIVMPFLDTLRRLLDLAKFYKDNHYTVDSFFKLVNNTGMFMIKHKDIIVSFSLSSLVENILKFVDENITQLTRSYFITSLTTYRNSKSNGFFMNMMFDLRAKLFNIRKHVQIEKARDLIVSNNIKINKLTEICLKQSENSTQLIPVFSKGIDKNILKFIV